MYYRKRIIVIDPVIKTDLSMMARLTLQKPGCRSRCLASKCSPVNDGTPNLNRDVTVALEVTVQGQGG